MDRMSEPDAVLTSLGAYVLGALSPLERADVEAHLLCCAACREELAGLAGLPGLLGRLDQTDLARLTDGEPQPDNRLLDRTLLELSRRRRARRRRGRLLTAAAAVGVVALGATALLLLRAPSEPTAAFERTVSATNSTSGVQAQIGIAAQPWGTALHLVLRGVPPGTRCRLVAVLHNGQRQTVGSWQASYEGTASIDAAADTPPNQLAGVEVVTDRGVRLVSIPLAGA